jgi:hypothetical protein
VSALVRDKLQEEHRLGALANVANRLIATSFYYQAGATTTGVHGVRHTVGRISCRFDSHSDNTKRLGKVLLERCDPNFEPFFSIGYVHEESRSKIWMTPTILSRMCQHGVFDVPEIKLPMGGEPHATAIRLHLLQHDRIEPEGYPISGVLCPKVIGPNFSGDQSAVSRNLEVKERVEITGKKEEIRPLDKLQDTQGPSTRATAALLKIVSLPSRPATTKPQQVFDNKKLLLGEAVDADEVPPPYDLSA